MADIYRGRGVTVTLDGVEGGEGRGLFSAIQGYFASFSPPRPWTIVHMRPLLA